MVDEPVPGPSPDIRKRTVAYALRAIRLFQHIERMNDGAARVIGKQFLRAATSVGANVQEAQAGESRADFVHKLNIAQKEARECLYWLHLLQQAALIPEERIGPLLSETSEILAILSKIIITIRRKR